jgi:hypothetical protein
MSLIPLVLVEAAMGFKGHNNNELTEFVTHLQQFKVESYLSSLLQRQVDLAEEGMRCGLFAHCGTYFWMFQQHGVVPDIVLLSKPMGNGFPVAARREVAQSYGGNSVACAIAEAVLDTIDKEKLQVEWTQDEYFSLFMPYFPLFIE